MNDLYDLSARVSLNVTGFSAAATMALAMFERLHTQAGLATSQLDKLAVAFKMFAAGAAITAAGAGLFAFMDSAVKKAMALQTIMQGLQLRTGIPLIDPHTQGFTAQGQRLQRLFETIGLSNQMSSGDVAGIAQAASRAGITNMGQLTHMLKPLANYSEIMLRATGADPAGSAKIATEFAHLYGAFGSKKIGGMLDTAFLTNQLGKAMQIVPVSQDQFLRLVSQFVGTERPLYRGKSRQSLISDTIDEGVLLAQMGQGSRGGNQIARLITGMMGGARGKTALDAVLDIQRRSGVHFANTQGQINDPSMLLKALATTAQTLTPAQTLAEFTRAFQQNGARLAGLFSDPIVGQRLKDIAKAMKAMPDLAAQQRAYNASPAGQFNQARKNFDSAMTALGVLWLPIATRAANALAGFTAGLVKFTQAHPKIMQVLATFIAVGAAVALVVGPLLMLAGLVAALSTIGLPAILAALGAALVPLLAFAAIVAVVTLAVTLWHKQIGQFVDYVAKTLGAELAQTGAWIHNVILPAFYRLGDAINYLINIIPHPHGAGYGAGQGDPSGSRKPPHPGDVYRDGHWYALRSSARGSHYVLDDPHNPPAWVTPPPPSTGMRYDAKGRAVGGGGYVEHHNHFGPITIAPVVHAGAEHDEETLARRVGTVVMRELGDNLQASIDMGGTTALGLYPSLQVAR